MPSRPIRKWRPSAESLEGKRLCTASVTSAVVANPPATSGHPATAEAAPTVSAKATEKKPTTGFLVYRITNPTSYNGNLTPPFGHVFVSRRNSR